MKLGKDYLKSLIVHLGFDTSEDAPQIFFKTYKNNYTVSVDFQSETIDYPEPLILTDKTTCNFSASENFVVLECINRLLEKGYAPQHVELERRWSLGHLQKSGKADITVYDRDGNSLIVIECKTFGDEYDKGKKKLESDGGQLFSYLQQDRNTRFLCLYASQLKDAEIVYQNLIVQIEDRPEILKLLAENGDELAYETAKTKDELHQVWKEQYNLFSTPNGIFDADVLAYEPQRIPIKRKDLKPFAEDEGRRFFNQFEEILRHNNISDKSNAFNRILSLILSKIVDEQKEADNITDFQISKTNEPAENILDRLQRLYKDGMKKFLKEEIVYISIEQIEKFLKDFPDQDAKDNIGRLFKQQKFYSSNEFAFKEIHNEKLFNENSKVLIEILKLLQDKQFRYARKDSTEYKRQKRYLGEFFELLLAEGYKQTAGQFFTPLPVAKFIVSALPIRESIKNKIAGKIEDFLPFIIDYACGSGHFLIESFDEIQSFLDELKPEYTKEINENIVLWQNKDWTEKFVYGIEKDYRLARTAKLACFMNGDGESNIIFGDGLEDYRNSEHQFPDSFDYLVANPPYSIKDFKLHTKASIKRNKFVLMEQLSLTASEIEVLFVERAAQLLHADGIAGIILPSSFLSTAGIYTKAREILLRHFEIRAVVEFGANTFMATPTNTVTLFLKKREEKPAVNANYVAVDFILHNKRRDGDFADTEAILRAYAETLGFTLDDYKSFLTRNPNDTVKNSDWFGEYNNWFENLGEIKKLRQSKTFKTKTTDLQEEEITRRFYDHVLGKEKDKFEFFFLLYGQQILVVRAPQDTKEKKAFLGYKKSKRRGKEGIHTLEQTALYDESNLNNPEKLNYLVRQMLLPALYDYKDDNRFIPPSIPQRLKSVVRISDLTDCFDFTRLDFEKVLSLAPKKKLISKWNLIKVKDAIVKIEGEKTKIPQEMIETSGEIPVVSQEKGKLIAGYIDNVNPITDVPLVVFGDHSVVFKYVDFPFVRGADGVQLLKPNRDFLPKAFYYILQTVEVENAGKYERHFKYLQETKIPCPDKPTQEQLVLEIEPVETQATIDAENIAEWQDEISNLVKSFPLVITQSICEIRSEKVEPESLSEDDIYIGLEHIEQNTGKLVNGTQNALQADLQSTKNVFKQNDVLYGKLRPYLNKSYIADFDGVCSTDIMALKTKQPKLLKYALLNEDFVKQTADLMKGMSLPRLSITDFPRLTIHYPNPENVESAIREIERLEAQINEAENRIKYSQTQKAEILRKYLAEV